MKRLKKGKYMVILLGFFKIEELMYFNNISELRNFVKKIDPVYKRDYRTWKVQDGKIVRCDLSGRVSKKKETKP